jgi:hypothetical protein
LALEYSLADAKKKELDIDPNRKPTFEEKKKLREGMFLAMEEGTIEETRLELAYEEAKEAGNLKKAAELADALFFVQRMHSDRLQSLINDYKPEIFTRAWGADPDYLNLMKELHMMSETIDELSPPTTTPGDGVVGKKRRSKKH